jgi:hypothetical protein
MGLRWRCHEILQAYSCGMSIVAHGQALASVIVLGMHAGILCLTSAVQNPGARSAAGEPGAGGDGVRVPQPGLGRQDCHQRLVGVRAPGEQPPHPCC